MNLLYSLFFGAGVAAFVFSKMSRRVGEGNTQSIVVMIAMVFVFTTIFFYTILGFIVDTK